MTAPDVQQTKSLDPNELEPLARYQLLISAVVPRPIAFVSTVDLHGVTNLAPFSFFSGVAGTPPIVSISIAARRGQDGAHLRGLHHAEVAARERVDSDVAPVRLAQGQECEQRHGRRHLNELEITGGKRIKQN